MYLWTLVKKNKATLNEVEQYNLNYVTATLSYGVVSYDI